MPEAALIDIRLVGIRNLQIASASPRLLTSLLRKLETGRDSRDGTPVSRKKNNAVLK